MSNSYSKISIMGILSIENYFLFVSNDLEFFNNDHSSSMTGLLLP